VSNVTFTRIIGTQESGSRLAETSCIHPSSMKSKEHLGYNSVFRRYQHPNTSISQLSLNAIFGSHVIA